MGDPQSQETTTRDLLGDDPVEREDDDLLRRGAFAARVTELIDNVSTETPSAVLALLGPWGSGKTSVLNFVRARLNRRGSWRVVEFNPWMVSDLPSLVHEFFTTLVAALPNDRKGKRLRKKLAGYAKTVAPFATPFKLVGINADDAARAVGDLLAGDESIEGRRRELEKALREHNKPILLVADDLDRLHPDELTLFFKLVRLVGRLPNVYYLLAFDETTVLDVLSSTQLAGGDRPRALAYLEKMVQVRLDLPPVHPRLAGQLLDQLLDSLISKHSVELDDRASYRLSDAYRTHLSTYLREPRQVRRYCAQIEALYPLLTSEVDFVDFAVVTFLRTFHPGVPALLRTHKAELTGTAIEYGKKPTHEQRRDHWSERLRTVGVPDHEVDPVLKLLGELFLPIRSAIERMEYSSGFHAELSAARRVGSSEYFDRYFHLGIGPDDLPDRTVVAAVNEVIQGSPGAAWADVVEQLSGNAELVLDKLHRLAPTTGQAAEPLAAALAAIADRVPDGGFFGRARIVHRYWLAELLLRAEPDDPRAFAEGLAQAGGVRLLADVCVKAQKTAEDDGKGLSDSFVELQRVTLGLLTAELDRQAKLPPKDTAGVLSLLADWGALDPTADRPAWMWTTINSGSWPLPDMLGMFVPVGTSTTGHGPPKASLGDTELGFLDQVVGLAELADKLVLPEDLGDEPFFGETDTSWEARVTRAQRAVGRWAKSNKSSAKAATEATDDPTPGDPPTR